MTGPAYHFVKYATSGKFSGLDLLLFAETRNLDTVLLVIKCSPYLAKLNEGILRLRESGNTEQIISQFLVSTTTYREAVRQKLSVFHVGPQAWRRGTGLLHPQRRRSYHLRLDRV
jgi:hypothetical protein